MAHAWDLTLDAFRAAIASIHDGLAAELHAALADTPYAARTPIGLAIGKVALAMARAFGPVEIGLCVAPHDDGQPLPGGWRLLVAGHPDPDERSLVAGDAAIELVERAPPDRVIVALISGGASALVEAPLIPLAELRELARRLMAAGAPIAELNTVRTALSAIKGGGLALRAVAPIVTLAASDVIGDDIATIGSSPTVAPWLDPRYANVAVDAVWSARRVEARRVLRTWSIDAPTGLAGPAPAATITQRDDRARVVVPMARLAVRMRDQLASRWGEERVRLVPAPFTEPVDRLARVLAALQGTVVVGWGEPVTILPPEHGEGGRMQQLALELARALRHGNRTACCIASDGMDGPPPRAHPTPAGAFVHGGTWDAIEQAGINPTLARARYDAGPALRLVDALIVTGPTGINHADLVVLGP